MVSHKINTFYLYCTLLYLAFLILIIVLADTGGASWIFAFAKLFPFADKFCHLILIGILSYFVNSALYCKTISFSLPRPTGFWKPRRSHNLETKEKNFKILFGSLLVYLFVLTEEFSQVFIPSRSADFGDALFDVVGIFLFGIFAEKNMLKRQ